MKRIILYAFLLVPTCLFSQVYNPGYKTTFNLTNDSSQTLINYQVMLVFNTAAPIAAGHLQSDGGDLRFTADSCNPTIFYDYWIENYLNTDSTKIWIKIPQLTANTSTTFLLWYGDSLANSMSSFGNTFPIAYKSNGSDTTFSGTIQTDWFELDTGDIIHLLPNSPLDIKSRVIIINGLIQAQGSGYSAPLSLGNGNGPGGGGLSITAGAGGGSFASAGGMGGYDAGDFPGAGGNIYGLQNDQNNWMGSSGGTTDNALGGNGGGAIQLVAEYIYVDGQINANGSNGIGSIGRCGGGGSGGGILLLGDQVKIGATSLLNAIGGDGGNGSAAANDGGGGGSGGRIKIFHGTYFQSIGSISLLGGNGGLDGSAAYGQDGTVGTYFDTTFTFHSVTVATLISETPLKASILGLDSVYCLNKDSILLDAEPEGGSFSGPGIVANYFYPLTAGVGVHSISYLYVDPNGCGMLYDTATVEVLNIPTVSTASSNSPICEGATLSLISNDSTASHHWIGPNGFSSNNQLPLVNNINAIYNGNYMVTITNSAGCTSTAQTMVTIYPAPMATVTNNSPLCLDDDLIFIATGGASYSWNGPNGFSAMSPSPTVPNTQYVAQGVYTVTITGVDGCQAAITTVVVVNACYDNIDNHHNTETSIFPNPVTNQLWLTFESNNSENENLITLVDLSGKIVMTEIIHSSNDRPSINLSGISAGVYILTIRSGNKQKTFKLIHQ